MDAFLAICQTQFEQFEVSSDIASRERNFGLQTRGKILLSNLPEAQKFVSMPHHKNDWSDQAVKVYAALGETKRAWRTAWQMFTERPSHQAWKNLQKHAETIGYKPDRLKVDVEVQLLEASKQGNSNRLWAANTDIVYFYLSDNQLNKTVNWLDNNKAGEYVLKETAVHLAPTFLIKQLTTAPGRCL